MVDRTDSTSTLPELRGWTPDMDEGLAIEADDLAAANPQNVDPRFANKAANDITALRDNLFPNVTAMVEDKAGLDVIVHAGQGFKADGSVVAWAKMDPLSLTNDDTNFIEVNGSGTVSANVTAFTAGSVPLAQATCVDGDITVLTDKRGPFFFSDNSLIDHGGLAGLGDAADHTWATLVDGTRPFTGDQSMGSNRLTSLATPSAGTDATTKDYVDALVQGVDWQDSVLDKDLTAPPGSPGTGDRYIVATGGSGAWSGQDLDIAEWDGAAWQFTDPNKGFTCQVEDESRNYNYNGSAWVTLGSIIDHGALLGLGDIADHPGYLDLAGTRPMTGALVMGGNLDMDGGAWDVLIKDDEAAALEFKEGANVYLALDTADGAETVRVSERFEVKDVELEVTQDATYAIGRLLTFSNDAWHGGIFQSRRARGIAATPVVVQSGDFAGSMSWMGYDGADYWVMAGVKVYVDGTPDTEDMPGRIVLGTTADGAKVPTDRLLIDSAGNVQITSCVLTAAAADSFKIGAVDLSPGNTQLSLYGEGTCVGVGTPAASRTVAMMVEGVQHYFLTALAPA